MVLFTRDRFSASQVLEELKSDNSGAVVLFLGVVRGDPSVQGLEIEVYQEMAEREIGKIEERARREFEIHDLRVIHRLGELPVGEDIVLVAVSSAHREAAFQAARFIIDEIKSRAPIWKKEKGTGRWVVG